MEAGERWILNDVTGKPIRAWDSRQHTFRTEYDPLRRPLRTFVTNADPAKPDQELLTERLVYGEQHPEGEARNLRGRPYLHLDQAGVVTTEACDFKGNPLRGTRRLAREYKQVIDWGSIDTVLPLDLVVALDLATLQAALAPLVETESYTNVSTYDALNRPVPVDCTAQRPAGRQRNIIQPAYNEANLLERLHVWLDLLDRTHRTIGRGRCAAFSGRRKQYRLRRQGSAHADRLPQRRQHHLQYDPLTFRLLHLQTSRNADAFLDDCPPVPPPGWPGCQVQNLHYTYDPVGNITHIRDDAQQIDLFPQSACRAERRLHLRRHLPADRSHGPRASRPTRRPAAHIVQRTAV